MPATSALPILLSLLIRKDVRAPRALSFPTTMPVCLPLQGTAICKTEGLPLDHPHHHLHLQAPPLRPPLLLPTPIRIRDLLLLADIRNLGPLLVVQEQGTSMEGHLPFTLKLLPLIPQDQILEPVRVQHLEHPLAHPLGQLQDLPQDPTQVLFQAQVQVQVQPQPQPPPQTALQMPTT